MIVHRFEGAAPGPALLLLAGVHGEEKPGVVALERLAHEFGAGRLRLLKGSISIVPRVNALAVERGVHQVDENLNRIVRAHAAPATREQHLANELLPLIEAADAVLDLHGTPSPTLPFAFLDDESPANKAWADAVGVDFLLTGWPALYAAGGTVTTTEYAQSLGKRALTIEVGQNEDRGASDKAFTFAARTLAHFGLISPFSSAPKPRVLRFTRVIHREPDGRLARDWKNFDPVAKGEILARYAGRTIEAPEPGFVVMPFADAETGMEWLYLAVPA